MCISPARKAGSVAQVRAVDAASGQELASITVHGHAQKENESQSTVPEWPAVSDVKSMALHQGIADAQRLYATWIESREIRLWTPRSAI